MIRIVFFLCLLATTAHAQAPKHPIDVAHEKCTAAYQNDPDFMGEPGPGRACDAQALRQWNAELSRLVAADKRPNAKAEQTAWVKRRDAAVNAVKRNYAGHLDTMNAQDEIRDVQLKFSKQRVLNLSRKNAIIPKK